MTEKNLGKMNIKIVKSILAMYPHCSETYAIARSRTGTHTQVSLQVIFIACTKSYFYFLFYDIYPANRTFPKCGLNFAWEDILFELLGWIFKTALYAWITFRKQIFCEYLANQLNQKVSWTDCWRNLQTVHILISS